MLPQIVIKKYGGNVAKDTNGKRTSRTEALDVDVHIAQDEKYSKAIMI